MQYIYIYILISNLFIHILKHVLCLNFNWLKYHFREAQEEGEEGEYEEGEYEEGEYEEGEYEEGEYEEGEYEEGEYEEGEYEEGEYEEGEYDEEEGEYEEGEYETEGGPFIPSPDYADGLTPTQIFVESASDIRSLDHDVDESELMENAKDLLAIPEKRSSISSLQIDESEMGE